MILIMTIAQLAVFSATACSKFLRKHLSALAIHAQVTKPSMMDAFTDQFFAQLALQELAKLPRLTSANLKNCMQLSVAGVSALALAALQLTHLTLPHVCVGGCNCTA